MGKVSLGQSREVESPGNGDEVGGGLLQGAATGLSVRLEIL